MKINHDGELFLRNVGIFIHHDDWWLALRMKKNNSEFAFGKLKTVYSLANAIKA